MRIDRDIRVVVIVILVLIVSGPSPLLALLLFRLVLSGSAIWRTPILAHQEAYLGAMLGVEDAICRDDDIVLLELARTACPLLAPVDEHLSRRQGLRLYF